MQTGADLVSAGLPTANAWTALLGGSTNAAVPNTPARSNLEWFGLGNAASTTFPATTGLVGVVAVPVTPGLVVTNVEMLVTATAASAPTHQFAALYAGTGSAPALIAQTTDATSTAVGANNFAKWTFGTPQTISATNCPSGFLYAAVSMTATTIPTVATVTGPATAAWYTAFYTNYTSTQTLPIFFSAYFGSAVGATAPSTITTSVTANTVVPLVWLT